MSIVKEWKGNNQVDLHLSSVPGVRPEPVDPVEVYSCSLNCALNIDLFTTEINDQLLESSL